MLIIILNLNNDFYVKLPFHGQILLDCIIITPLY